MIVDAVLSNTAIFYILEKSHIHNKFENFKLKLLISNGWKENFCRKRTRSQRIGIHTLSCRNTQMFMSATAV